MSPHSSTPSSSSLLNVWARGNPTDQLTPKASAQSGTSTEIDPFDNTKHQPLCNDDYQLKTPMPQSLSPKKNYFSSSTTNTNTPQQQQPEPASMATNSLKAFVKTYTTNKNHNTKNSFNFTNQPITRSEKSSTATAASETTENPFTLPPIGLLKVKIVSARALRFAASNSRPYVYASFDNNEFASREPIGEEEEETRGVPTSTISRSQSQDSSKSPQLPSPSEDRRIPTPNNNEHQSQGNGLRCLSGQNPIWKQEVDFDVTHHKPVYSPHHSLYLSVYDRSLGDTNGHRQPAPPQQTKPTPSSDYPNRTPSPLVHPDQLIPGHLIPGIEGVESFLGETQIKLDFKHLSRIGGWIDQWYPLTMRKGTKTGKPEEEGKSPGELRIQLRYHEHRTKKSLDVSDFEFLKMIGKGTFGRVFQVRKKDTRRIYAMKVLSKKEVIDKKEVQHTIGERNILQQSSDCPFLLGLKFSFQSPGELFLVMDYKSGGELFHHLQKEGRFTEERARFYTAEIVLALEHLHMYNIVYRDLKPENILLDATGHIVLCDFGLSKPNLNQDELTTTFCGTTEYLAPEVLLDDHGYSKLVDFWSLGVLLFEMCCGWSPFYAEDNQQMYKNICFGKIKFPRGVIGDEGKQFVKGLLNRNPKHRLGSQNDTEDLKKHEFFKSIDWHKLSLREVIPTFKPHIESDESVSNFDREFTTLDISEHLPSTIKERLVQDSNGAVGGVGKCFDENDRSDDWVKKASYVPSSVLPSATATHQVPSNSASTSTVSPGHSINPASSHLPPLPSSSSVSAPAPASAAPLTFDTKASDPNHDQDQFLGFSYHGESELFHLAHNNNNNHQPPHSSSYRSMNNIQQSLDHLDLSSSSAHADHDSLRSPSFSDDDDDEEEEDQDEPPVSAFDSGYS
ncbi:hypothetical protein PGT21_021560 [Puccinia graminis f. sp. tritici]|uniref:AGC/AKT protein kinase n=1 Tax=Puccinia graminis f. sp. tritici TaxID=56615 RepID=A0A5B0QXY0_PUCGR|nr:hypothetical protein PGT21_021560 [Puccinia graminis f. sp. tritici]